MDARNLDSLRRRPLQYWYVDGLQELHAGVLLLVIGGVMLMAWWFGSPAIAGILVPVLAIGGNRLGRRAVENVKGRVTFPRTGFIELRKPSGRGRLLAIGMAFAIVQLLVVAQWLLPISDAWAVVLTGGVTSSAILVAGIWFGLPRFVALGILGNAFAIALGVAGLGTWPGTSAFLVGMGVGFLASGAIALRMYLRSHSASPAPEPS